MTNSENSMLYLSSCFVILCTCRAEVFLRCAELEIQEKFFRIRGVVPLEMESQMENMRSSVAKEERPHLQRQKVLQFCERLQRGNIVGVIQKRRINHNGEYVSQKEKPFMQLGSAATFCEEHGRSKRQSLHISKFIGVFAVIERAACHIVLASN